MNSDDKFWLSIWSIAGVVVLGIALSISSYWKDHNSKIVTLIKQGVDPVAVMCAMQDDYGTHPTCIVLAVKK